MEWIKIKNIFINILGFNYRMTNLQAAIGLSQIKEIKSILKKRRNQMEYYYKVLSKNNNYKLREFENWCKPVHWLTTIILNKKNREKVDFIFKKEKIDSRQMVNPINDALHIKKLIKKNFL